jgi:spore photoproduct lyase
MGQVLHGSAATTEAVRRATQQSQESLRSLARRYGIDPVDCVYGLGENGDLSVDASLSDNVRDLVGAFRAIPNASTSC